MLAFAHIRGINFWHGSAASDQICGIRSVTEGSAHELAAVETSLLVMKIAGKRT